MTRRRRTGRPPGRPRALSPEQVADARQLHADGMSFRQIAKILGCSRTTIGVALRPAPVEKTDDRPDPVPVWSFPSPAVPTLAQIREQWAADLADDEGWWPPTIGHGPAWATGRRDLSW